MRYNQPSRSSCPRAEPQWAPNPDHRIADEEHRDHTRHEKKRTIQEKPTHPRELFKEKMTTTSSARGGARLGCGGAPSQESASTGWPQMRKESTAGYSAPDLSSPEGGIGLPAGAASCPGQGRGASRARATAESAQPTVGARSHVFGGRRVQHRSHRALVPTLASSGRRAFTPSWAGAETRTWSPRLSGGKPWPSCIAYPVATLRRPVRYSPMG